MCGVTLRHGTLNQCIFLSCVYRYDEERGAVDPGFPRLIAESWNDIPDGLDAAFSLNGIGKKRTKKSLNITFLGSEKHSTSVSVLAQMEPYKANAAVQLGLLQVF